MIIEIEHVKNRMDTYPLSLALCKNIQLHDANDLHPIPSTGKCRYEHS